MDSANEKIVKLVPKEGRKKARTVSTEMARISKTLKDHCSDPEVLIPLPTIEANVLDKIVEWLEYHQKDRLFLDDKINSSMGDQYIDIWDRYYFQMERELLFKVLTAANYLDISDLLSIGCKTAAKELKGRTAEEVRRLWNIESDLSPEDEIAIKRANAWTET